MSNNETEKNALVNRGRRLALFVALVLVGLGAVVAGIAIGDPETIHRFAAQI